MGPARISDGGAAAGWEDGAPDDASSGGVQVIGDLARVIKPIRDLGIISADAEKDLHPAPEGRPDGHLTGPGTTCFSKGVGLGFGRTDDDEVIKAVLHP